jgi:hypothetical protein
VRHEKISVSSKSGKILPVLIFSIVFVMPGFVYKGHSQDCEINCPLYEIIYTSKNLSGHVAFIEPNPGGGTQCPFAEDDAKLISYNDYGEVISNPNLRNVWINAIGAKKFWDKFPDEKNIVLTAYKYSGEFRLPTLPAPDDTQLENAEAVHFMIQLFDGTNTLLEADNYSLEFSILWKLNAWTDDYGKIFVYTGVSDSSTNPFRVFETQLQLEPDTNWHRFEMIVDFETLKWVSITIDGIKEDLCDLDAAKVKHDDWGDDFFLCITTESQSTWPQYNCEKIFTWTTQFRNLEFGYWPAIIESSRTQLIFAAIANGIFSNPQSFMINNSGCGTVDWTVSNNASWLNCTPTSGTGPDSVSVSVDPEGLTTGSYTGTITVTDTDASNSPQTIPVTLNVYNLNQTSPPFGDFSTPLDGSTVRSNIPVTGWVLDDIEVESVKIYRDPLPGEGSGKVYIGDAVFVEGARPDVEAAYPGYPMNYRAGWGYMMLTNFLPDGGNSTFKLHAVATDADGHQVTLGTKTIICDNANAVKPFGAIDTPTQGGTASASDFINWGWVLTPPPNSIPTDGSTINVYVDGIKIGHPTYNIYRVDIASKFPDYANSDGAIGYFYLDTAVYENGVHTIQWTATDSGGNTDGIGSRYFTIQNTGNPRSKSQTSSSSKAVTNQKFTQLSQIVDIPINDLESIRIKRRLKDDIEPEVVSGDESGVFVINIKELDRLVVDFPKKSSVIEGYTIAGNRLRPLPIGSIIDSKEKKFYWQPGPGFVGAYRFLFIKRSEDSQIRKIDMIVKIEPKFANKE